MKQQERKTANSITKELLNTDNFKIPFFIKHRKNLADINNLRGFVVLIASFYNRW